MMSPRAAASVRRALDVILATRGEAAVAVLRDLASESDAGLSARRLILTLPSAPRGITDADVRAICAGRLAEMDAPATETPPLGTPTWERALAAFPWLRQTH